MRVIVRAWRRRHVRRRAELQRSILDGLPMVGADVGAAEGLQPHWWEFEGAVDLYLFEPHPDSADKLERIYASSPFRQMFHVERIGLARESGTRTLHVLNAATGSSIYPIDVTSEFAGPRNSYVHPVRQIEVAVRNLSEVLTERGVAQLDVAKLDVQGAELEILKGLAPQHMQQMVLLEAEVSIAGGVTGTKSPYVGVPSWSELDAFALANGMRLLDVSIARSHRSRDGDQDWYQREIFGVYTNSPGISAAVWEADAVYVRDYRGLIERADAAGIRKLLVALGVYRYFSEAYYVVEEAQAAGVFTAAQAGALHRALVEWHRLSAKRPWHGRNSLLGLMRALLARLGWSQLRRWKQYMWFEYPNG